MTATLSAPGSTAHPVRIRRAPALEPPSDDRRRPDDHPICAGQLALFTSVQSTRNAAGPVPVPGPAGPAGKAAPQPAPVRPRDAPPASAAQAAAARFVAACVEVLNGFRPVAHLRALTTPFDYATVVKQLTHRAVRVRMPGAADRVGLHRVRVFEQRAGVAEAVAVLRHGNATWAIALRFERQRGAWLCSLLEVV